MRPRGYVIKFEATDRREALQLLAQAQRIIERKTEDTALYVDAGKTREVVGFVEID